MLSSCGLGEAEVWDGLRFGPVVGYKAAIKSAQTSKGGLALHQLDLSAQRLARGEAQAV